MKTRKLILGVIPILAVLVLTGGSASAKKVFAPSDKEEIYGTWVNTDYGTGFMMQKVVYRPDGKFELFYRTTDTQPYRWGTYTLTDKWTDSEGNIWYKKYTGDPSGPKHYHLDKISNSGKVWEYVDSSIDYPTEIDPKHHTYHIYYREE